MHKATLCILLFHNLSSFPRLFLINSLYPHQITPVRWPSLTLILEHIYAFRLLSSACCRAMQSHWNWPELNFCSHIDRCVCLGWIICAWKGVQETCQCDDCGQWEIINVNCLDFLIWFWQHWSVVLIYFLLCILSWNINVFSLIVHNISCS